MYFTNITNEELQTFHKTLIGNFTIKATDTTNNPLFHTEQITENITRIIPLFYTRTIHSTNRKDKIINNQLIIHHTTNNPTYYTFTSNTEDNTHDYTPYGEYYNISNTLTPAEFNSIIQNIRYGLNKTEKIQITNGTIHGEYGDYTFNIDGATINDKGILITKQTQTSLGTITLTHPVYLNSTYEITLQIFHITDINIIEETPHNNIVIDPLTLTLEPGNPVNIPYNTFEYGYTILFPAVIEIHHNQPIILGRVIKDIQLETTTNIIADGETTTLTATATDLDSLPISNLNIGFYMGETLLGETITNNDGVAVYELTGNGNRGLQEYTAKSESTTSNLILINDCICHDDCTTDNGIWRDTNATFTYTNNGLHVTDGKYNSFYRGNTHSLNGGLDTVIEFDFKTSNNIQHVLVNNTGGRVSLQSITDFTDTWKHYTYIYHNDTHIVDIYVDHVKVSSVDISSANTTTFGFQITDYQGDGDYWIKDLMIYKYGRRIPISLTLEASQSVLSAYHSDVATLTATVVDQYGEGVSGESVVFRKNGAIVDTIVTDNTGVAEYEYEASGVGDIEFTAKSNLLTGSVTIEDCILADITEQTFSSSSTLVSDALYADIFDVANTDFELVYDIKTAGSSGGLNIGASTEYTPPSSANYRIFLGGDGTNASFNNRTTSSNNSTKSMSHDVYHTLRLTKDGTSVKGYVDDTLIATKTITWLGNYSTYDIYWTNWGSTNYMKNLKIKPLLGE